MKKIMLLFMVLSISLLIGCINTDDNEHKDNVYVEQIVRNFENQNPSFTDGSRWRSGIFLTSRDEFSRINNEIPEINPELANLINRNRGILILIIPVAFAQDYKVNITGVNELGMQIEVELIEIIPVDAILRILIVVSVRIVRTANEFIHEIKNNDNIILEIDSRTKIGDYNIILKR